MGKFPEGENKGVRILGFHPVSDTETAGLTIPEGSDARMSRRTHRSYMSEYKVEAER